MKTGPAYRYQLVGRAPRRRTLKGKQKCPQCGSVKLVRALSLVQVQTAK